MIGARMAELLKATAEDCGKGDAPLSHQFLLEHDVTMDEAYDLADWIARCIDIAVELNKTDSGRRLMAQHIAFGMVEREMSK